MNKLRILIFIILIFGLAGCENFLNNLEHRNPYDPYKPLPEGKARVYGKMTYMGKPGINQIGLYFNHYASGGTGYEFILHTESKPDGSYMLDNINPGVYEIQSTWGGASFSIKNNEILRLDINYKWEPI